MNNIDHSMPTVHSVKPGRIDFSIIITWVDGNRDTVNLVGVVHRAAAFEPLRDPNAFRKVKVIDWGGGIGWPDFKLDYGAESIERLAIEQRGMSNKDFIAWQERLSLSNQEAADLLEVSTSTLKNYRRDHRIPTVVSIACSAMAVDRTAFYAHFRPRKVGRPKVIPLHVMAEHTAHRTAARQTITRKAVKSRKTTIGKLAAKRSVGKMAKGGKKVTSPRAASAASKVLRSGRTGKTSKTAAGSALSQREKSRGGRRKK